MAPTVTNPDGPDVYSPYTPDSAYQGGPGGGHAKREYECGMRFDGHWKNDDEYGPGTLQVDTGSSYVGEWHAGLFHGEGKYAWASGSVYEGQWVEGRKEGRGKLTLYSGNTYQGEWVKDQRHGWGLYKVAKPTAGGIAVYEGEWVKDDRTGKGTTKGIDGALEINKYENGMRVGDGVRWLNASRLKANEPSGPFRLKDGKEIKGITATEAEGIAKSLGLPVPSVEGFHP